MKKADLKIKYDSLEEARNIIGEHVNFYNNRRPQQALWNFTPDYVHRVGNKSLIYEHYRNKPSKSRKQRLEYWMD